MSEDGVPELRFGYVDILTSHLIHGNKNSALITIKDIKRARGVRFANRVVDSAYSRISKDRMLSKYAKDRALLFFESRTYWKQGVMISSKKGVVSVSTMPGHLYITVPVLLAVVLIIAAPLVYEYTQPIAISELDITTDAASVAHIGKSFYVSYAVEPSNADTSDLDWNLTPSANVLECEKLSSGVRILLSPSFNESELTIICHSDKYKKSETLRVPVQNNLSIATYGSKTHVMPGEDFTVQSQVDSDIDLLIDWEFDSKQITTSEVNSVLSGKVNWDVDKKEIPITATISGTSISSTFVLEVDCFATIEGNLESSTVDAGGSETLSVKVMPSTYDYNMMRWSKDSSWVTLSGTGQEITATVSEFARTGDVAVVTAYASGLQQTFVITVGKDMGARLDVLGVSGNLGPDSQFTVAFSTNSSYIDTSSLTIESDQEGSVVSVLQKGSSATVRVLELVSKGAEFTVTAKLGKSVVSERTFTLSKGMVMAITGSSGNLEVGSTVDLDTHTEPYKSDYSVEWISSIASISIDAEGRFKVPLGIPEGVKFTVTAMIKNTGISARQDFEIVRGFDMSIAVSDGVYAGGEYEATAYSSIAIADMSKIVWKVVGKATVSGTGQNAIVKIDKWAATGDIIVLSATHLEAGMTVTEDMEVAIGSSINLSSNTTSAYTGDTVYLSSVVAPANNYGEPLWACSWGGATLTSSGDKAELRIDDIISESKTITVSVDYGGGHKKSIDVVVKATIISLTNLMEVKNGDVFSITSAVNIPGYDDQINWTIEGNTASVELENSVGKVVTGKVSLLAEGNTSFTIKASLPDTGVSKSATYVVKERTLTISGSSVSTISPGASFYIRAYGFEDLNDLAYEWTVESPGSMTGSDRNLCYVSISNRASLDDRISVSVSIVGTGFRALKDFQVNYDQYDGLTKLFINDDLKKMNSNLGGSYVLMNDLDLNGVTWSPIGYDNVSGSYSAFTGTFDGGSHQITNFKISQPSKDKDGNSYVGFISIIGNGGSVSNLTLSDVSLDMISVTRNFNDTIFAGILTGLNNGTINHVCINGSLTYNLSKEKTAEAINTGGIAGLSYGEVCGCASDVTLSAYASACVVGGVVGGVMSGSVSMCSFSGTAYGYAIDDYSHVSIVGGLVGFSGYAYSIYEGWFLGITGTHNYKFSVASSISITKCTMNGTVRVEGDNNLMAKYYSGAILGNLDQKFEPNIMSECSFTGGGKAIGNR